MIRQKIEEIVKQKYNKGLREATNQEIYITLLEIVKDMAEAAPRAEGKKKLYYISAEFLIGKLLSNNLINLWYL